MNSNSTEKENHDNDLFVNSRLEDQQTNFKTKKTKFNVTKLDIDLNCKLFDSNEKLTIIDSAPNPIYYRNLLSINGAFKSRPTLEQLQVRSNFIFVNLFNFWLNFVMWLLEL